MSGGFLTVLNVGGPVDPPKCWGDCRNSAAASESSPIRDHTGQLKRRPLSGKQRRHLGFVSEVPGFSRPRFVPSSPAQLLRPGGGGGVATVLALCRCLPHSLAGMYGVTWDVS